MKRYFPLKMFLSLILVILVSQLFSIGVYGAGRDKEWPTQPINLHTDIITTISVSFGWIALKDNSGLVL
jgi:hypothetical protein